MMMSYSSKQAATVLHMPMCHDGNWYSVSENYLGYSHGGHSHTGIRCHKGGWPGNMRGYDGFVTRKQNLNCFGNTAFTRHSHGPVLYCGLQKDVDNV